MQTAQLGRWAWVLVAALALVVAIYRWGWIAGTAVSALVAGLYVLVRWNGAGVQHREAHALWLTLTLMVLSPLGLALLIFAVTPTYFRPLYTTSTGGWLLLALAASESLGYVGVQFGLGRIARRQVAAGAVAIALALALAGAAFLLILLAPPLAVLTNPRPT